MSRGLGRIERAIVAILKSRGIYNRSTDAFDAWHLAESIYDNDDAPTRTQRLAILRGMHSLAHKFPKRYAITGGKGTTPLYLSRVKRPQATRPPTPFRSYPARRRQANR